MTLKEASNNIGNKVVYIPFKGCENKQIEAGVITSVNSKFVFVRYGYDVTSKATNPDDIELE